MNRFIDISCEPQKMSALNLAFVGDGVFELFVREKLICTKDLTVKELHGQAVKKVCCQAQADAAQMLMGEFTEDEMAVYLRGRNAHPGHLPKNASPADYHAATALEAVFGYLYLSGNIERLQMFFEKIWKNNYKENKE